MLACQFQLLCFYACLDSDSLHWFALTIDRRSHFFLPGEYRPFLFDEILDPLPSVEQSLDQLLIEIGARNHVRKPPMRMLVDVRPNLFDALYVMPARLFLSILVSYIIALAEDSNGLNAIFPGDAKNPSIGNAAHSRVHDRGMPLMQISFTLHLYCLTADESSLSHLQNTSFWQISDIRA